VIDASLEMPDKVRDLQIKLYRKAKSEPDFGFYQLYDKVYRADVLLRAWVLAKANHGAPGVDGESFGDIESKGVMKWLDGLGKELHDKTYQPQPVRRVRIPKPGGGERPLGIPTVSANCTGAQIAFGMGGDPPSVPSALRPALPGFESASNRRY
jgi:RNA-directed DNA polymerase